MEKQSSKKKCPVKYTPAELSAAVHRVLSHEMGSKQASKHYGIPRSTIRSRVELKNQGPTRTGPITVLTPEEELELESWVFSMQKRGFPVSKNWLLDTVKQYLDANPRENSFVDNRPGRTWLQLFFKRHPTICMRTPEFVTSASSVVSPSDIIGWFRKIEGFLTSENFSEILQDPNRIINGDETSFQLNPKSKAVLALKGSRNVYDIERSSSKLNITTMFSFSASGETVPPTIIYPYKTIPKVVADSVPSKWGIAKSDNGWMTADVFRDYIRNVLNPHLERNKIKKPVMFVIDGHSSHINLQTSTLCREMGIILVALYPNVTRIMQPADVAAFKPLKNGWAKAVERFRRENPRAAVTTQNFAKILQDCLRDSLTVKSIKNGFRASGLFPWNSDAIDFGKCLGESSTATATSSAPDLTTGIADQRGMYEELQQAKRTLEQCAEYIGSTKIKKFKSDFVCFENNEEQILYQIYSTLQSNCPELVEGLADKSDDRTFCRFDYASATEATLVSQEKDDESNIISTYEATIGVDAPKSPVADTTSSKTTLKDFLNIPSAPKRQAKREYASKRFHVLTSDEFIEEYKQKDLEKSRLETEKQQRKIAREARQLASEKEKKEKAEIKAMKIKQKENKPKKLRLKL